MEFSSMTTAMKQGSFGFSWDEIQKMIEIARKNDRLYALLVTLAYSGRRIGEIVGEYKKAFVKVYWINEKGEKDRGKWKLVPLAVIGLTPEKIDFNTNVITWCIEKKKKIRNYVNDWQDVSRYFATIEAHPLLLAVLKDYIMKYQIEPNERIFKFQRQHAYKLIRKIFDEAGIKEKKRIVHAFRHGFAIELLKKGERPEDLVRLQNLLQHDNIRTTMSYAVYSDSDRRKLLEKLK